MRAKVIGKGTVNALMLFSLVFVGSATASMPVPVTITGCVIKGIMLSEETDFGSRVSKGQYEIKPVNRDWIRFDLSPYEGNLIQVKGNLLPGDRFVIDPGSIKIMGPCRKSPGDPFPADAKDVVITLERTLCFGTCPAYTVTVYGNGTVVYEGRSHVKIKGRQTAAISREKVKEPISGFQKIDYFSLRGSYEQHYVTDFPYAITSIRINGEEKTIRHYGADRTAPRELHELEKRIDEIAGTERWIKGIPEKDAVTPGGSSAQGPDNKAIANQLRNEGYSLQKNGDLRGAIKKYGESLRSWPDKQLEKHINLLELKLQGRISDRKEPHDETLCGLVDLSEAAVPGDFVMSYATGPLHAEWGGRSVLKIYANGDIVVTKERRKDRSSPPDEETLYKQISLVGVQKIYGHVTACGFFDLEKQYWNRDVRDGGSEYLEVTANGKTHSVRVYYYRVERFRSIVSVLEEETAKAVKKTSLSVGDAERIIWGLAEVRRLAEQIRKSGARPFTRVESKPESNAKPGTPQSAYAIYFGEDRATHTVRVMTFFVDSYTGKVSVYDVVSDNTMFLEEWRKKVK